MTEPHGWEVRIDHGARRPLRRIALALLILAPAIAVSLQEGLAGAAPSGGSTLWLSRYDGPAGDFDKADAIVTSPDGSLVVVTGVSQGPSGKDYATVAYDASTGSTAWLDRYDGPGHGDDEARSMAAAPEGSAVFVTGMSPGTAGDLDFSTIAYDAADGSRLWVRRFDGHAGHSSDLAVAVAASPDGSMVFVTGWSIGSSGHAGFATVAYDARTGITRWVGRYETGGGASDYPHAIAVGPDGSKVFVSGYAQDPSGDQAFLTVAFSSLDGQVTWVRSYTGPAGGLDSANSVAVSTDGASVFVAGSSDGSSTGPDFLVVAYDASTGTPRWRRRFDTFSGDVADSLAVSPDGSKVFVTGVTGGKFATVALDPHTGTVRWYNPTFGSFFSIEARGVAVNHSGTEVFVTGEIQDPTFDWQYATLAYDAGTGSLLWRELYNGAPGNYDIALALTPSPDGTSVFVTGYSWGPANADYATIAYSA